MENLFNEVNIASGHHRSYGSRIMSGSIRVRYKGKRSSTGNTSYSVTFSKGESAMIQSRILRYATLVTNTLTGESYIVLSVDRSVNSLPISDCGGVSCIYGKELARYLMEISGADTETHETVDIPIHTGKKKHSDKLVIIIDYGKESERDNQEEGR